jgi:hypothetical protein
MGEGKIMTIADGRLTEGMKIDQDKLRGQRRVRGD